MKLLDLLSNPAHFFEDIQREDWKPALVFFFQITVALAVLTPVINFLGIASTDCSSAYQAQIIAYRLLPSLSASFGVYAFIVEGLLIVGFSLVILGVLTALVHVIFRVMGGAGPVSNAWKSSCYGVGPSILGGFIPYVSLFGAAYSLLIQLYVGPKVLYGVKESRAIAFLALILALVFVEMLTGGTTVGLFI